MRFFRHAAAAALLMACFVGLSATAQAGHADRYVQVSATNGQHVYRVDPYAYYYEQRGYYPHYQSSYWRPLREVRQTNRRRFRSQKGYRYKPSWGNPWGRHRYPRKSFWFWHY